MFRTRSRGPSPQAVPEPEALPGRFAPLVLPALWGALALCWKLVCPLAQQDGLGVRAATGAVFFTVGTGLFLGLRRSLVRQLRQARQIADAAQRVLLPPPPARLDGLAIAAGQLSAARGAVVGGDLYEAVATPHGVRIVVGDVRGHGLAALGTVAAVLGGFREAAHDERELAGVLRRLERTLARHARGRARQEHPAAGRGEPENPSSEEFVTVLLLQVAVDGDLTALNCGHPWPYRLRRRPVPLCAADPLPPLGAFPLPDRLPVYRCGPLAAGEALLCHTDGAADARDAAGRFFDLEAALAEAAARTPVVPAAVVRRLHGALLRHTGGRLADDVALLVLRNDRSRVPAQSAEPEPRRTRTAPSRR
ncbi:PP2C family protein-serine/threonine phosphatase [Streptomyces sp. NPDC001941]|uniref:PP2C family protein-serine/threonine phosphatase n=1 Tax=Streptomyces sp. NPDC001941 TaxID=3154659 RepID=UPI0033265303